MGWWHCKLSHAEWKSFNQQGHCHLRDLFTANLLSPHHYFRQTAQYVRSSIGLVWGTCSAHWRSFQGHSETCGRKTNLEQWCHPQMCQPRRPLLTNDKAPGNQLRKHPKEICKALQMIVVWSEHARKPDSWNHSPKDNISLLFTMKKWQTSDVLDFAQNTPRNEADSRVKGWIQGNARIGTALEVIATNHMEELKSKLILCKEMDPYLG